MFPVGSIPSLNEGILNVMFCIASEAAFSQMFSEGEEKIVINAISTTEISPTIMGIFNL